MIKVKGKTLPRVRDTSATLNRVEGTEVAEALGAELTNAPGPSAQRPVALFALRQALAARLRSTGGRPSLGASRRQKIPLDDADWMMLCQLSEQLADTERHPTPGQVASVLLRQRLRQVIDPTSKLERQDDMLVSKLYAYVEALGGEVEIRARFPNEQEVQINQFEEIEKLKAALAPKTKKPKMEKTKPAETSAGFPVGARRFELPTP